MRPVCEASIFSIGDYHEIEMPHPTGCSGWRFIVGSCLDSKFAGPDGKNLKFDDYVDMRALRELDKEGAFK